MVGKNYDRIQRYINNQMTLDEEVEFSLEISESEELLAEVSHLFELHRSTDEKFIFDELCIAFEKGEWDKVQNLGIKMSELNYSELAYPIMKKVDHARKQI